METKLKSVLRNPRLRLAFKALIFAGFLALARFGYFGFLPILFFFAIAVGLYVRPMFRTMELVWPFLVLVALALTLSAAAPASGYFLLADLYFASLFYLLLGVKDLIFIQRDNWYRVLNLGLAYSAFWLFFYYNQDSFLIRLIVLFFVAWLLLRDLLKKRFLVWLLVLMILEIVWAISLLPIGFAAAANLALLSYFVLSDLALLHLAGPLSRRRILSEVTLMVLLAMAIFAFSRWSL